jgi:hypothetical protein
MYVDVEVKRLISYSQSQLVFFYLYIVQEELSFMRHELLTVNCCNDGQEIY